MNNYSPDDYRRFYNHRRHNSQWRILCIPVSTFWKRILWCIDSEHHNRGVL